MTTTRTRATPRPLATPAEVADYLGVTPRQLRRWRERGNDNGPRWVAVSGRPRYAWVDVDAYLKRNARGGTR